MRSGKGSYILLYAVDFVEGEGTALEAGQQYSPQAVANGHAEAALERLRVELAVGVGKRLAIAGHAARQFQPTPLNSHKGASHDKRGREPPRNRHARIHHPVAAPPC